MEKLNELTLKKLINENINESTYVDFKLKHHENPVELVHDILCLSNADTIKDRYILFGVNDDGDIKGLGVNSDKRRKDNDIIDTLRKSKINRLPELSIYTIISNNLEIDVLQIYNCNHKPYFLTASYTSKKASNNKTIRAGIIFSRNGSANTPIDSSASEVEIQEMWRERFGLTLPPLARMLLYIENTDQWIKSSNSIGETVFYYKPFPEFTIVSRTEMECGPDFWEHWNKRNQGDSMSYELGLIKACLSYHSTVLQSCELINVEHRLLFATPSYTDIDNIQTNPKAKINRNSASHKIAAIFEEKGSIVSYEHGLQLRIDQCKLDVDLSKDCLEAV